MWLVQTIFPSCGTFLEPLEPFWILMKPFFLLVEPCGTFPPLVGPCGTFFLSSCCQLSLKVQGRNHRSHRGPAITISKNQISNFQQPKSNAANMASLRSCNFCIFCVRFCFFVNELCWLTRVGLMSFKCLGLDIAHPQHQVNGSYALNTFLL